MENGKAWEGLIDFSYNSKELPMSMGTKQKLIGDEFDVVRAKHMYLYTKNVSHKCKKRMSRRRRKKVREDLKNIMGVNHGED